MTKKEEIVFAPYDRFVKYLLPIVPERLKPNHLTFIRLVFSPILIILLGGGEYILGLILFIILALTDILDGSLARLRDQITDWGKVWDPIADKILIGIVVVVLLLQINFNLTVLLLSFELAFILGGAFQKMSKDNIDIQANIWGKIKMNLQAFGAGFLILGFFLNMLGMIFFAQILLYLSLGFALFSILKNGI
jgi:CDP-diacylglycerol--glycerol-3-phosphate 3-phosphatidyltransferase